MRQHLTQGLQHRFQITILPDVPVQGVYAHRFRDVCPEVRMNVIEGLATWIHLNPAAFLNDNHLKYVGWALSDKARPGNSPSCLEAPLRRCGQAA